MRVTNQAINILDHFNLVERSHGSCWLHKTAPVWIVKYNAFPKSQQPEHWQAYYSIDAEKGRDPWTCDNRSIKKHGEKFPFRSEAAAVKAALEKVAEMGMTP